MSVTAFLVAWRTTPLHDREVVDALVDPAHAEPSAGLAAALREWPGTYYWSSEQDGRHLVLTRPTIKPRESWTLHAVLFAATLFLTTMAGALLAGGLPPDFGVLYNPTAWNLAFFRGWATGFSFSLPLLAILFCHEMGHYLTARHYQVNVSPPHFLPGPPPPIGIGTFGAFIRLRTILNDRRQLLDVGAAGPIAGFVVALPVLWLGLAHSQVVAAEPGATGMQVSLGGMLLGDSAVTLLLRYFTHTAGAVVLSQLDGGHILYAALPRAQRQLARLFFVVVILLGFLSRSWFVWAFVVLLLSRGQFAHPPVLDAYRPLPKSRIWLLVASLVLFALTFTPAPSP